VLVKKTETIKKELGSLSKVIDDDIERRMGQGIRHRDAEQLAREGLHVRRALHKLCADVRSIRNISFTFSASASGLNGSGKTS
jgi:hypothetical protein